MPGNTQLEQVSIFSNLFQRVKKLNSDLHSTGHFICAYSFILQFETVLPDSKALGNMVQLGHLHNVV